MFGQGEITVACDDPAALDQFESLLRTMSQGTGYAGRDFSVFVIRKADAARVAETLTQLFRDKLARTRTTRTTWRRTSRLVIVPDERMNAILVQGSRADRAKIETLLEILDTDEDAARGFKIIQLKKANAKNVQQALEMILREGTRSRRR
jgi:type II secretory pathway component GspD/PulD (secretin)